MTFFNTYKALGVHLVGSVFWLLGYTFIAACPSSPEQNSCVSHADCTGESVCVDKFCRPTCNYNRDCATAEHCEEGACMPGAAQKPDAGLTDSTSSDHAHLDASLPDQNAADISLRDSQLSDITSNDSALGDTFLADAGPEDLVIFDAVSRDLMRRDVAQCPLGEHDGGDGVCVSMDVCSDGFHNGGDGACWLIGICAAEYHDAGDGRCFPFGFCASGFHDDGLGICVAESLCAGGFHDGGDGTCVSVGDCLSAYHDGGDGACVVEGACSEGFHDGGIGICLIVGSCAEGYHDGGDGTCVVVGECSAEFSLYYTDVDGDGFGVGDQSEDCVHPSLHLAVLGGDCDDENPDIHVLGDYYSDHDGDGYTLASSEQLCSDGSAPTDYADQVQAAPYISFGAAEIVDENDGYPGEKWEDREKAVFRDGHGANADTFHGPDLSHALLMTDFGLQIPENAQILGLRVHFVKKAGSGDEVTDSHVALQYQGVSQGINHAQMDLWPENYTDAMYGGRTHLWGLSLTPQMLNDPSFGVVLVALLGPDGGPGKIDAYVDNVWIEVFTDPGPQDCDDGNENLAGTSIVRIDVDGDGYGGEQVSMCVGQDMPPDYVLNAFVDCYDSNDAVYSGVTAYHTTERGDGSFDYNCDGIETKQIIHRHTACTYNSGTNSCSPTNSAISANACGQNNVVKRCVDVGLSCNLKDTDILTACR